MPPDMHGQLQKLQQQLRCLRCPAFLRATEQTLQGASFRKTLALWLYAVYHSPALRENPESDAWTAHEPSDAQLKQWLRLMGVANSAQEALLEGDMSLPSVYAHFARIADTVQGRMLLQDSGESACLGSSMRLLDDLGTHQADVFDARCEIFPLSISMISSSAIVEQERAHFAADIVSLANQVDAVRNRVAFAKERLQALDDDAGVMNTDQSNAKRTSEDLGGLLNECAELMERASIVFRDEVACWMQPSTEPLIGLGQAAHAVYQRIDHVLTFLEQTEASRVASQESKALQTAQDITIQYVLCIQQPTDQTTNAFSIDLWKHSCQQMADAAAPELREQLQTLELALSFLQQ